MVDVKKILVIVADSSYAKVFIAHGPHKITEIHEFNHPAGRLHNNELTTKAHDVNTCPYEDSHSQKQHERNVFAKKLAQDLIKIMETQNLKDLCIIAPPHFLGEIHKDIKLPHIKITTIHKDQITVDQEHVLKDLRDANVSFMP